MELNYYQQMYPFEERRAIADKVKIKKPDHIPIVIVPVDKIRLKKYKILAPKNVNVSILIQQLKKFVFEVELAPHEAVFLFSESKEMFPGSLVLSHIYEAYKNEDGHLYIYVQIENTFGGEY